MIRRSWSQATAPGLSMITVMGVYVTTPWKYLLETIVEGRSWASRSFITIFLP